jgi:hypothetical protein
LEKKHNHHHHFRCNFSQDLLAPGTHATGLRAPLRSPKPSLHSDSQVPSLRRNVMTGRVKFATSTAPRPPLADLVSNSTPPGQITRERASLVNGQLGREIGWQGL